MGRAVLLHRTRDGDHCLAQGHEPLDHLADLWRADENNAPTAPQNVPVIGHDVWNGVNAVVIRGVTVGHSAVIGASTVEGRDMPPYAVVGRPARHIRDRFPSEQAAALLRIRWWVWELEALAVRDTALLDTPTFIALYDTAPEESKA